LFAFREAVPTCAVYYVGWNDLRNSHVKTLRSDFSDFHLPNQKISLGLQGGSAYSAFLVALHYLLDEKPVMPEGAPSAEYDERLGAIYARNMELISVLTRQFGVRAIFVPQVLNFEQLTGESIDPWVPFVREKDLGSLMKRMNQQLARAAQANGAAFLGDVSEQPWSAEDFFDQGHFRPAGSRKFALALRESIATQCGKAGPWNR